MDSVVALSIVFGLSSMVAYGVTNIMGSMLTKRDNAIRIILWYYIFSSALLAVIGVLFFKLPQLSLLNVFAFAVLSSISVFAFVSFLRGMRVGKVSVVAPIANSWSVIAVLAGVLFLHEAITPLLGVGIVLTVLGTALVSFKFKDLISLNFGRSAPGVKYAAMTMLGWGVLYTSIGIISRQLGWLWPILILSVGSTIVVFVYSLTGNIKISFPTKLTNLMFWYVLIGTAGFLLYSLGTSRGDVSLVGPLAAASPFVTVILARVLVKERIDANQIVGIACIILGLVALAY